MKIDGRKVSFFLKPKSSDKLFLPNSYLWCFYARPRASLALAKFSASTPFNVGTIFNTAEWGWGGGGMECEKHIDLHCTVG